MCSIGICDVASWRNKYTNSGADSIGHGGHVPPLLQMAGHEGHCG